MALTQSFRSIDRLPPVVRVRAVGLAWMGVDVSQKTLSVAISAPDKITPRQLVNLSLNIDGVKAGEQTYVTLAAVDEGILQLTRYETPDPVNSCSASGGSGSISATITVACSTAVPIPAQSTRVAMHRSGDSHWQ